MALILTRFSDVVDELISLADTDVIAWDVDQGGGGFLYEKMTGATFKALVRGLSADAKLLANVGLSVVANTPTNGLTISLKQKDGTTDPGSTSDKKVIIAFRSATLTSGGVVYREVTTTLSSVITSGSTIGFFAAKAERLHIFAIDDAGTVRIAFSGSNTFSEADLHTTTAEGGAGGADSKTTLYADAVYTNVAIRYLGYAVLTEATPGTHTSSPSKIVVGTPSRISQTSSVVVDTGNGHGSTDNKIRRFTNSTTKGTAITHATSAANGDTFTINEDGMYAIIYTDIYSGNANYMGISINSNQLTTIIESITAANVAVIGSSVAANRPGTVTLIKRFSVGDILRAHDEGNMDSTSAVTSKLIIEKIGD